MKQVWARFRGWPTWAQWVIGIFVAIVLIGALSPKEDEDQPVSAGQANTTQATLNHTPASIPPTVPPPTPPPTPATTFTAAGPKTTFGNGTHRVGIDIAAGTYIAPGGNGCYWERQSVFGGSGSGAIIANELSRGGQVVVTIEASDKGFKTTSCGTWTKG